MQWRAMALVLGAGLLIAAEPSKRVPSESESFQGAWTVMSLEINGKKLPEKQVQRQRVRLTIKGKQWVLQFGGKIERGTMEADASKTPQEIDIKVASTRGKARKVLGIYELDGDTLKIAIDNTGKGRPRNFDASAKAAKGLMQIDCKRVKRGR